MCSVVLLFVCLLLFKKSICKNQLKKYIKQNNSQLSLYLQILVQCTR